VSKSYKEAESIIKFLQTNTGKKHLAELLILDVKNGSKIYNEVREEISDIQNTLKEVDSWHDEKRELFD
jgi:hypothetical protein